MRRRKRRRQETFLSAVEDCQCQTVRQLVQQGSSVEQRDVAVSQAVSHSQWGLVVQLVQLGVSQQCRDLAVQTAARYCLWDCYDELLAADGSSGEGNHVVTKHTDEGQWELVFAAVHLGIDQRLLITILKEVASHGQWEQVPSLTRLYKDQGFTYLILRAAVECSQWDCVQRLVKTGLTRDQQAFVCREALKWAHFDCALELLRQGCDPECAVSIVLGILKRNRRQDLIDLLKEDGLRPGVREAVLQIAKEHDCCDEYLAIVKDAGATGKDMADFIRTALRTINAVIILRLFSVVTSARRVFKQVLLQTRFSDHDINSLCKFLVDDHPDLAFYMLTAQEMWGSVVSMFGDARLSRKDKRYALRHAIRKSAWEAVRQMVICPSTHHSERRYAFLQAARRRKWRLSLQLSTYSKNISLSDQVFALRLWLKHGLWNCLQNVQKKWVGHSGDYACWKDSDKEKAFMECILEESIIAENLEEFTDACNKMYYIDAYCNFVLDTAIKHNKCNFIVEFCRHQNCQGNLEAAVKLAIKKKKWSLLKDLIEKTYDCVDDSDWERVVSLQLNLLHMYVQCISQEEDAWQIVVPPLNCFCASFSTDEALYLDLDESFNDASTEQLVQKLAAWCLERSYGNVGLVLYIIYGSAENATKVIDLLKNEICRGVLMFCFTFYLQMSDLESASTCLQHLSISEVSSIIRDLVINDDEIKLCDLVETCRGNSQNKLVVCLGVEKRDWEQVTTALAFCEETTVIDFAIEKAVSDGKWDIVQSQLGRCSQDNSFLCTIFSRAVTAGRPDMCTDLISKINILQTSITVKSLLNEAVTSRGDREEMVKLCIEFGFSTHITTCTCTSAYGCSVCWDCPTKTALYTGQMPVVKLLYQAGACCNKQLFRCKENANVRNQLQGQGRQDIVEYLDHATTTPRTLQDLCRLQVSHLIGCHPGRVERVMSLDIPWPTKDLINFKDVLS